MAVVGAARGGSVVGAAAKTTLKSLFGSNIIF
jgi:hypothetical protein